MDSGDWGQIPFQLKSLLSWVDRNRSFSELRQICLDTLPGSLFHYSNAGAELLGYCLEAIYLQTTQQLVKKHLLAPLSMTSSLVATKP